MAKFDETRRVDRAAQLRQSYLTHPGETPDVDYKAAHSFKVNDDFALDLVRHVLGMANSGGGTIVVGYKEDTARKPQPDPAMTESIAASYDASDLASYVEKHVVGTDKVGIRIFKETNGGVIYPILEIDGFARSPFFCRSTKTDNAGRKEVLKEGALYVRIAGARTVQVASPSEWEQLVEICVARRQDEFLSRMAGLLEQMGLARAFVSQSRDDTTEIERIAKLDAESTPIVQQELNANGFHPAYFEVIHLPVKTFRWSQDELLAAAERSKVRRTGWPIGVVLHNESRPRVMKDGIVAKIHSSVVRRSFDYWRLREDGGFYFARTFQEDSLDNVSPGSILWFDTRIWRIAEAFEHGAALYEALGVAPTEEIRFRIAHHGLNGRLLSSSDPRRDISERKCVEKTVVWEGEVTRDKIRTQLADLVLTVCNELFVLFDFVRLSPNVLSEILGEYMNSRV